MYSASSVNSSAHGRQSPLRPASVGHREVIVVRPLQLGAVPRAHEASMLHAR